MLSAAEVFAIMENISVELVQYKKRSILIVFAIDTQEEVKYYLYPWTGKLLL